MRKIHVYLDDMRPCPKGFTLANSMEECIVLLRECPVGILSLDFDLGWNQPNGYELATYMVQHGLYAQEIYFHSSDPAGRLNMYRILSQNKPEHVILHPGPMPQALIDRIGTGAG